MVLLLACIAGCATGRHEARPRVAQVWSSEAPAARPPAPSPRRRAKPVAQPSAQPTPSNAQPAIAIVDGQPIPRDALVDLLLRGRGPGLLEQLIVLDRAERRVAARGGAVTEADVEAEYDRALQALVDPLGELHPGQFDRPAAERALAEVLTARQMSHEEFRLGMRRNALLRRLARAELAITSADLEAEYERVFGERVEVRHIQLATLAEVARVRDALAGGADFAELAQQLSAHRVSAAVGGLLPPFTRDDPDVPTTLRHEAWQLPVGGVSQALRLGAWYQLIRVERRLPVEHPPPAEVEPRLRQRLERRRLGPAVEKWYRQLLDEADVRISDPVLREAWQQHASPPPR